MIFVRRSRALVWVPLFCLALLGLAWFRLEQRHLPLLSPPADTRAFRPGISRAAFHPALIPFWDSVSKALLKAKPTCTLQDDQIQAPVKKFTSITQNSNERPDLLRVSQEDGDDLRNAHIRYVAQIPPLAAELPYMKGTRGIVTTAAGEFLPTLVVSLRMLRRTGSKLPVQVFVGSNDVYEKEICEEVLPALNATCFLLSDVLDAVPQHVEISQPRFQLRVLAMLFSSFDEILLLDADGIVVERPEWWMTAKPFVFMGFVSWPDYWASTASRKYFEISSQSLRSVATRASSESGLVLLSKSKHGSTLLLSLYYNVYGPSHYYKLLSQGSVGQGDKETYLAAAISLNASFYTVNTNVEEIGYRHDDNQFKGCGAVQFNAEDDYNRFTLGNHSIKEPRRAFVHAQTYSMNAGRVTELFHGEINQRMWGAKEQMIGKFGIDLEKQLWAETLATGCQFEHYFRDWVNKTQVCKKIGRVYKFLYD